MAVKIRLARGGAKKKPYYRIVVANATAPRDGDFLEKVGTYNPLLPRGAGDRITLKTERIAYWLSKGATPTDTVARFIDTGGIELPEFVASKMAVKAKVRKAQAEKAAQEKAAKDAEEQAAAASALATAKAETEKAEAESQKAAEAAALAAAEEATAPEAPASKEAEGDKAAE